MINNSILKWTKDIILTSETAQLVYPVAGAINSFYSIKPKFPDFSRYFLSFQSQIRIISSAFGLSSYRVVGLPSARQQF